MGSTVRELAWVELFINYAKTCLRHRPKPLRCITLQKCELAVGQVALKDQRTTFHVLETHGLFHLLPVLKLLRQNRLLAPSRLQDR